METNNVKRTFIILALILLALFVLLFTSCSDKPQHVWYNKAQQGAIVSLKFNTYSEQCWMTTLYQGKDSTVEIPKWLYSKVNIDDTIVNK